MSLEMVLFRREHGPECEAISADVFAGINIPFFLEDIYGVQGHGAAMNAYWARMLFERHPETFLVALEEGRVAGFTGLTAVPEWGLGWVVHLGVARWAQGRGIGRRMVESGLDVLRSMKLPVSWIEYDRGNERAGGLYRRLGFVDFGRVQYFAAATDASRPVPPEVEADAARLANVAGSRPLFAEEVVVAQYGLPASQAQVRRRCLAERLEGARAFALGDGGHAAFALAAPEGDGRVLHLPAFWAGDAAAGATLLHGLGALGAGEHGAVCLYVELYEPSAETLAALAGAGFREVHGLGCLARRL